MKKFLNGKMVEMTATELQKYEAVRAEVQESEPEHEITPEERIEALETAFMEFVEVVLNG